MRSSSSSAAPIRLPINPPMAAPATVLATRPAPRPNWEPTTAPPTTPATVPVFSCGPAPVTGFPAQAPIRNPLRATHPACRDVITVLVPFRFQDQTCGNDWGETLAPHFTANIKVNRINEITLKRKNAQALKHEHAQARIHSSTWQHQLGAQPSDRGRPEREVPAVE